MQVRFADRLPEGEFALVIPASGADADSVRNLGGALTDALTRQRFDGEAGSIAEHFHEGRRVVVVGVGRNGKAGDSAEKIGGNAVAKLLTSGEKHAVFDLTGLGFDADSAAKVGLGAALRRLLPLPGGAAIEAERSPKTKGAATWRLFLAL